MFRVFRVFRVVRVHKLRITNPKPQFKSLKPLVIFSNLCAPITTPQDPKP